MWDTVLALLFSLLQNPIAVSAASQGSVQLPLQPHISEEGNLLEPEFQDTSNHDVHINFESAEHDAMGQFLKLRLWNSSCNCPGRVILGNDPQFLFGGQTLPYSNFVPMADLYSNWAPRQCPTQISDPGLTLAERQANFQIIIDQFNQAQNDSRLMLCVITAFVGQETDIQSEVQNGPFGGDPAQLYAKKMTLDWTQPFANWDLTYLLCTQGYLWGAFCNWDHFGMDAVTAYKAAHSVALEAAQVATTNGELLFNAYYYEGLAQHYLSDLFSAGHLRVPRRIVHSDPANFAVPSNPAPGDQCSKTMHDEDSANGLWVQNARGDAWPVYGDKQLFGTKSLKNRDIAFGAMQAGLDEVLATYVNKTMPSNDSYAALEWVPSVQSLDPGSNFVPLLQATPAGGQMNVLVRSNLDNRADASTTSNIIDASGDNDPLWKSLNAKFSSAGFISNLYPRSMPDLMAEVNITQLRQLNSTHMLINRFGPLWTNLYQPWPGRTALRSWNMVSQSISPVAPTVDLTWTWAASRGTGVYVLGGVYDNTEFYLGLQNQIETGGVGITQLWNISQKFPGSTTCNKLTYSDGIISGTSKGVGFVRRCDSSFQLWVQMSPTAEAVNTASWTTTAQSQTSDFVVAIDNENSALVSAGYDPTGNIYVYNVTSWVKGFTNPVSVQFTQQNVPAQASAFLVDTIFAKSESQFVVRITALSGQVRVDTTSVNMNAGTTFSLQFTTDILAFDVTPYQSLRWSLMDVDGDGNLDLMAYGSRTADSAIVTAIFKNGGQGSSIFGAPAVTPIAKDVVPLFNAPFMTDIISHPTQVWNSRSQQSPSNRAGMLQLFDNYGILGVRLFGPTTDCIVGQYCPIGQTPAIAGQISKGLGPGGLGFLFD